MSVFVHISSWNFEYKLKRGFLGAKCLLLLSLLRMLLLLLVYLLIISDILAFKCTGTCE